MFGRTVPYQNHSHWEVLRQRVSKWKPDSFRRRKRGVQPSTAAALTWRGFFSLLNGCIRWRHYKGICKFVRFPRNVSGRSLSGTVFWRLEHLCSVCICISCKLVSSASGEGMSQAFGQISFGTHTDFTLPSLSAPVLPFFWLVAPASKNLYVNEGDLVWGVVSKLAWVTKRWP